MPPKRSKATQRTVRKRARTKTASIEHTFGRLMTAAEVAYVLHVDVRVARKLIRAGHLSHIDLVPGAKRRMVRVGRRQLEEYLASRQRPRAGGEADG